MNMTLDAIARALTGTGLPGPEGARVVTTVRTDSREVKPGDLFVCLKGENFDAHDFAAQVAQAGAAAIVAAHALADVACPVILVDDTLLALGRLARAWRDMTSAKVVAITGTAGKTTVKELLAQTLAHSKNVAKNHKNFNNQVGLPLSMLAASGQEDAWVMEVGISKPHDMAELGVIIAPDLALVLNIGPAHLEGLGSIEGVAEAKASLLAHVREGGLGLCSMDYPELWDAALEVFPGVVGFSAQNSFATYYARFEEALSGGRGLYEIIVDGESFWAELPACGAHFAENAAAVAGACHMLGLSTDQIAEGLGKAELPGQRFCCSEVGGWCVVDDSYNANPLSMRRSMEAARLLAGGAPLVLVLGDMKELGAGAEKAHEELGALLPKLAPAAVFFQGEFAAAVAKGAGSAIAVTKISEPAQVLAHMPLLDASKAAARGVVLVKGSRSCRMELYAKGLLDGLAETTNGGRA
ncbi:MAG: UDP-N-acetylmuramoyl-tripeptide--D-alanyl-D-alanine ligase [Humidesulfovibrio sp.]|uniref:UDP-N-acetylmuramoyl-tripeptide--D-alanyl-D- alanine ligase n=1 Tax=Humidesulfovibrio sp. TaxID=2910988 RepID=UPI0027FD2971|nr:UDP-N-acetylmuramoyl-tripeptide--D-alanyl-D-alanine ligase [Humidesulfovibrio sp.]MDQ7834603.1 UDP-N-acetylmuramoyl-tripeptide--D-alanyl-D-alanine ligase [Humidesulfovibrio sp.]